MDELQLWATGLLLPRNRGRVYASGQPGLRTLGYSSANSCPSLVDGSGARNSLALLSLPAGGDIPAMGT